MDYKPPGAPYVGLTPFHEKDAPFFFGRESERDNIISNLMGSRLTVLYGPAGVGKSSVLNAGVAYHMRRLSKLTLSRGAASGLDEPAVVSPSHEFFIVVFNKWRDNPLQGLAEQIRREVEGVAVSEKSSKKTTPTSLVNLLRSWTLETNRDFFIILDQFEDYFFYSQKGGRDSFEKEFPLAVNESGLRVNFLISIKEDSLAKLDRFNGPIPGLFNNSLRIEHLSRESAWTAIKRPIDKFNQINSDRGWEFEIEPQLIDTVLDQVGAGQGLFSQEELGMSPAHDTDGDSTSPIEPAYLQLVMTRLWDEEIKSKSRKLQYSTLTRLGGARHIVKTHLDQIMNRLDERQRRAAMQIFVHLVSPTGNKTPESLDDLVLSTGLERKEIDNVLNTLSSPDARVLKPVGFAGSIRYEIFHDVLIPTVLRWRRKYELDQERIRANYSALVATAFILLSIVLLFFIISLNNQKRETDVARADAEKKTSALESALKTVNDQDRAVRYFHSIMRGHRGAVYSAAFSPDDGMILTASDDGTAKLWNTATGGMIANLPIQGDHITNAEFSPNGQLIVTASRSGIIQLWQVKAEEGAFNRLFNISAHTQEVNCASFSPDSSMVATSSVDGTARIWDAATGNPVADLRGHAGLVNCSFFSPDNKLVVTSSIDGTAKIWEARMGRPLRDLIGHAGSVNRAVFNNKGSLIATASSDGTGRIWNAETGKVTAILRGHTARVNSISFSRDDRYVVTSSFDNTARVWDVSNGRVVAILQGHKDRVVSARFSPDGTRVVTASDDNTARVWEAMTGQNIAELRGHTSKVNSARFSSDGNLVATSSGESRLEDTSKESKSTAGETIARVWDVSGLGKMRIEEVTLTADPYDYSGPCPGAIRFFGKITVAGGGGTVWYRFVSDKNKITTLKSLKFESPGTKDVSTIWKFGGPTHPSPTGTFTIEVISPVDNQVEKRSDPVRYNVECQFFGGQLPASIQAKVGALINGSQRDVVFEWTPVEGAVQYKIEVEFMKGSDGTWIPLGDRPIIIPATETRYTITLTGAKRARWRICSSDSLGRDCQADNWTEIKLP